jgi:FkbM family methyltransferase
MIDKIKQNWDLLKKAYKLKKLVKNSLWNLYLYAVLKPPYVELELTDGSKLVVNYLNYREILDGYYLGHIINLYEDKIKVKLNDEIYFIPVNNLSYYSINNLLSYLREGWECWGNYWEKDKAKFRNIYYSIIRVFEEKQWDFLNVQDKNVLDIGAFVGDSAIYFILKGAKKVYAIEPYPNAYNEMWDNIILNDMEEQIIPINMGISYKRNYVVINTKKIDEAENTLFKSTGIGVRIPAGKLSKIIDKYNIDAQILKMDCEGCEYDIILKDYDTIKEFDEIGFEYHAYNTNISVNELLKKLSKDFECRIIRNWSNYEWLEGKRGILHCIRKR